MSQPKSNLHHTVPKQQPQPTKSWNAKFLKYRLYYFLSDYGFTRLPHKLTCAVTNDQDLQTSRVLPSIGAYTTLHRVKGCLVYKSWCFFILEVSFLSLCNVFKVFFGVVDSCFKMNLNVIVRSRKNMIKYLLNYIITKIVTKA